MLQKIHDQAQSWVAWVIVGLLIIPFALWGINSYFDGGGSAVIADIDGTEITLQEYQRSLQQQRQRMRSLLGTSYRPEMLENPQMRRAVLDAMIENELLSQNVAEDGFRIGDGLLLGQIERVEAFQQDGVFSPVIYEQVLAAQGMSKPFFENSLRGDLMQSQHQNGFRTASFVTQWELQEATRLLEQKRTMKLLTIPATVERLEDQTVSEEAVTAHYQQSGTTYEVPEQVSIEYLELSVSQLAEGVSVDEAELTKLYGERKESLMADEERNARHILIELAKGANDETVAAAEKRLSEVQHKLASGESFESLAKTYSDDPGSATAGGDLGFFSKGIMVPEFDAAVFSMAVGETSEPVRTDFGFHLIRLEEIQASELRPYEEVRDELLTELKRRQAEELFYEHTETISNIAYEEPDSLDGAANTVGLTIQKSELFSRQGKGKGVTGEVAVTAAAFSDLVLKEGKNSDPIELAEDHVVILRLLDHQVARKKPLESVRDEVVQAVLKERAQALALKQGKEWIEKLSNGSADHEVAEQTGLKWGEQRSIERNDRSIPSEVVTELFRMSTPEEGKKRYQGVELVRGGYAIMALKRVDEGRLEALDEPKQKSSRLEMADRNMRSHYQNYIAHLRSQSNIRVYEDQL
ncbi:MAG: peptidylprolyl isomerase [Gammaproteobacteria bacterium]|jgi:peptidyl-prolyl cis-trans isomerase D|nr:peptidylprolyl isomerase [Gammaproteobacteria bacterium]MBT3489595.1 peptidylprolyl isomerase [Gammaproteobacteria bacterium]MBT3718241.1 peptidylprolyl isomerase [Gammaproteobacteria bacterium]MBT3843968.1 peptidylprolyl isomerase [Gammaproteobacteria bacterium]MBT3892134.1 peptidylprolyl isomerase [Gammaproteobacteria bacterium]